MAVEGSAGELVVAARLAVDAKWEESSRVGRKVREAGLGDRRGEGVLDLEENGDERNWEIKPARDFCLRLNDRLGLKDEFNLSFNCQETLTLQVDCH